MGVKDLPEVSDDWHKWEPKQLPTVVNYKYLASAAGCTSSIEISCES